MTSEGSALPQVWDVSRLEKWQSEFSSCKSARLRYLAAPAGIRADLLRARPQGGWMPMLLQKDSPQVAARSPAPAHEANLNGNRILTGSGLTRACR